MIKSTIIYLDVCCLNRPFDDQTQDRIHLEAEAVLLILKRIEEGKWIWKSSEVVQFEISQTPNLERRAQVQLLTNFADETIVIDELIIQRAEILQNNGFKAYDALHLACAESAKSSVFLTTDDRLLKRAQKTKNLLKVSVHNPLNWLQEQLHDTVNKS